MMAKWKRDEARRLFHAVKVKKSKIYEVHVHAMLRCTEEGFDNPGQIHFAIKEQIHRLLEDLRLPLLRLVATNSKSEWEATPFATTRKKKAPAIVSARPEVSKQPRGIQAAQAKEG